MNLDDQQVLINAILDVPLNRHLGCVFDGIIDGVAHTHFDVRHDLLAFGSGHAGALYTLMDATCLLALLPSLDSSQHAVTHDMHGSIMRPLAAGARCYLSARVVKLGRTLAFIDATAEVEKQLVASARVTKSLTAKPSHGS